MNNKMSFNEAWPILQEEAINKLIHNLEVLEESQLNNQCFTSHDYMRLYTVVYNVCYPNNMSPEVEKLYEQYKRTFEDYISVKVLPSLRGKENEDLLKELLRRWNNHKTMTRWLSRFFNYLSRYFIPLRKLPSLQETSLLTFRNLVHGEIKDQIIGAIVSSIDREREGKQIDQAMVKDVMDIYVEMDKESVKEYYAKDLEEATIEGTATFYSKKALVWISNNSYENYMLKVEECLEEERKRVCNYLRFRSKDKISEVLPSLRGKENEDLLKELLRRWNNHKTMTRWLSRFFNYLSRYFIPLRKLPSLQETSLLTFRNLVHGEIKDQIIGAIVSLIDREREGEQIDQAMVKDVMDIYAEMNKDSVKEYYAKDLEEAIIEGTTTFYSKKAKLDIMDIEQLL
ncbi:hypothetical protein BUALT_Bualt14G0071200 [Buddleja alternifolia]|uniref:Cullin N-terminal domain-containing protein n=1 Tax=Buddleja alternifolia TaxID=168488 RepID=A0AAV6WPK6_9LAMI|nr:hypothetical protein BUALT_Bualt14G0071200 [Buddleja alternifolia]